MNQETPDVQAGFIDLETKKGKRTRDQIVNIYLMVTEKARGFQKNIYFCFIDYPKTLTVWITINCAKFLRRWDTRLPDLPPEKSVSRSISNS